jgi:hypothetical protein
MDCPPSFWPNRIVDWIREEAAYMSEMETGTAPEESQSGRYVVIEIQRNEAFIRRFVISYRGEQALREPIAASTMLGIGLSFRKEAVVVAPSSSSRDAGKKSVEKKHSFRRKNEPRGPQSPTLQLRHRLGLMETRRIACATLRNVVVAGVLIFHSRSILGAVIRAFVCS